MNATNLKKTATPLSKAILGCVGLALFLPGLPAHGQESSNSGAPNLVDFLFSSDPMTTLIEGISECEAYASGEKELKSVFQGPGWMRFDVEGATAFKSGDFTTSAVAKDGSVCAVSSSLFSPMMALNFTPGRTVDAMGTKIFSKKWRDSINVSANCRTFTTEGIRLMMGPEMIFYSAFFGIGENTEAQVCAETTGSSFTFTRE
jgi:hypothetical protein